MLPPVLQRTIEQNTFTQWNFSYSALFTAISMGLILFIYHDFIQLNEEKSRFIVRFGSSVSSLCFLLIISILISFLHLGGTEVAVQLPSTPKTFTFCLINFLLSAFSEEVLYRFYAPEILCNLLLKRFSKNTSFVISEIFVCLMFALGHRYAGIPAVINSVLGYAVLRMNIKKTGSLAMNTTVHFLYNLIQLFN